MKIAISKFIDTASVDELHAAFDTVCELALVNNHNNLLVMVSDAEALIMGNSIMVDVALLDAAPAL